MILFVGNEETEGVTKDGKNLTTQNISAKARFTSVAIRIRLRDPDRHQNLNMCSLAHCQPSLKVSISCK